MVGSERSTGLFPEFPGQDAEKDRGEERKQQDLRSRGLCLVPVSCTSSHLAPDNDAVVVSDFWAAAAPAPLAGGIIHQR
ncbi:hypothetical protein ABZP36_014890 [Zizania latifolia]